jgi:transcriptional regulator of acetoin/glycerol metabolism
MTATTVLVSWVSFNGDPFERNKAGEYVEPCVTGPTLEILFSSDSPLRGRVKHVYLLARRSGSPGPDERRVHGREEDVAREVQRAIAERSDRIKVDVCLWDTTSPPTDHRGVFMFAARELARIRKTHMRDDIAVHLSPGTPAKHATLLLALQARLGGTNVRAYQTAPASKRHGVERFEEVPWNLLAELAASAPPLDAGTGIAPWSIDVARSAAMRNVAAAVAQFAGVPFPVLIIGSRGTGKTEIARRLRTGFRQWRVDASSKAWEFHLNCAEFRGDPNMLRSALFGHAKGAHSKAEQTRAGLLENAADDCVFLDEIHWMDPQAQGLLLLALQRGGSFRRLGDEIRAIPARFRLLAATNQKHHQLREHLTADFLDRISDLVIELPELRDCQEDLGDIWQSVVRLACEELLAHDKTRADPGAGGSLLEAYAAEFQPPSSAHRSDPRRDAAPRELPRSRAARAPPAGGRAEPR